MRKMEREKARYLYLNSKIVFERGDLKPDDQVWTESMKDWRPAFVITDIEHYLNLN